MFIENLGDRFIAAVLNTVGRNAGDVSISSLSAGPYGRASGRGTVHFYFITEPKSKV